MSNRTLLVLIPASLVCAAFAGCSGGNAPAPKGELKSTATITADPEVKASLAKLSDEDRKLANEQKSCPITGEPLGSMGVPIKLTLKDQTVFLCCASCKKEAEADADKTLKVVEDAKAKAKAGK